MARKKIQLENTLNNPEMHILDLEKMSEFFNYIKQK